ncbi:MAG: VOC family protein [Pseudomonadales bacterium]|nr:VOC family protein [Pseudomonadales bacterium]
MNRKSITHVLRKVFISLVLLAGAQVNASSSLPAINAPASESFLPGKFIWFDLASPDKKLQKEFYQSVFSWTFHNPGNSSDLYELIINEGHAVAGIFQFTAPEDEQDAATWIALMSVENVDKAVSEAEKHGAKIESKAMTIQGRGRHALLRDPAGALFGVIKSSSGDPIDVEVGIGDILWLDLYARDVQAMTTFYQALAPYSPMKKDVNNSVSRMVLSSQSTPRAGIVEVGEEANRSAWVPYIRVKDVDKTLAKVIAGGGFAIINPDKDIMEGKLAVFVDPNGAVMGLVEWSYAKEKK